MVNNNQEENLKKDSEAHKTQIISFYSYKGGVGKTTALIKTALLFAQKGKKTAIIDLDLEEPGFYDVFSSDLKLEGGIVNYLYNKYNGSAKDIAVETAALAKKMTLKKGSPIYVLPAGKVNMEYVKMLRSLKEKRINGNRDLREIIDNLSKSYGIDYVFIDARQGLNFWGGLSLNEIADEVMIFAYPDMENVQGTNLFLEMVDDKHKCSLIFSKIGSSETAYKEKENLLKKIDLKENLISISYDPEMAENVRYPLDKGINKYKAICDSILENEVKRKNKSWLKDHTEDVKIVLDNLAEGKDFNKILTEEELKILNVDNYALVIDDDINLKKTIEGYYEKKKVTDLRFFNKALKKIVEKHCSSNEFLDVCCLSMFSMALLSLDDTVNLSQSVEVEEALGKYFMDFYYKSSSAKGRILNASSYFCDILNAKKSEEDRVVCINIDQLIEYISLLEISCGVGKTKNSVLFRMLFLIFNVLNRNSKYQFKLILHDRKYKNDPDFDKEFKANLLELSWNDLYRKQSIIEKVEEIFAKTFKQEVYSKVKSDVIFPLSVESEGVKMKFDEWFVNALKRNRLLSRKGVLDIMKESAALEKSNTNEKCSIITFPKLETAIQRVAFR